MKRHLIVVAVAGLMLSVAGAWAQEGEGGVIENAMTACEPEITAFCSQVTPGEGRLLACFYAHQDKLSGKCEYALFEAAAALEDFAAAVTYLAESCLDDMEKHCAQVELGEGRVATCLIERKAEVTDACRQAMDDVGLELVEE